MNRQGNSFVSSFPTGKEWGKLLYNLPAPAPSHQISLRQVKNNAKSAEIKNEQKNSKAK